MKRLIFAALAVSVSTAAMADINGYKVEQLWNNHTGDFSSSGSFPALSMTSANQHNTANNTYGDRYVGWLSADHGATIANIDGHKDFSLFFTMTIHTDGAATRPLEGGLLLRYDNHRGFTPESQMYASFNPDGTGQHIQTSGDWVMPGFDFGAHGATITQNQTIMIGLEYDYDDANPLNSVQRLSVDGAVSPWINGNWGGPVYDPMMQFGFYFQPLVEEGNATHTSTADYNLVSFTGSVVPEPGTMVVLGLGAVALLRRRRK